jgi:hypothetical protein
VDWCIDQVLLDGNGVKEIIVGDDSIVEINSDHATH